MKTATEERLRSFVTDFNLELRKRLDIRTLSTEFGIAESAPEPVPEKPGTAMLRRMAMPELGGDARQALAVQVEDKLGYTPLRRHTGAPSRLQRLLQELEIDAFDRASVEEYKARMRRHHQALVSRRGANTVGFIYRTVVGWSCTKLSDYTKPVPEFVLHKCLLIKERAPDAVFWVDELREDMLTLDPFLLVVLGDGFPDSADTESVAIEVWDEPEFEHKL